MDNKIINNGNSSNMLLLFLSIFSICACSRGNLLNMDQRRNVSLHTKVSEIKELISGNDKEPGIADAVIENTEAIIENKKATNENRANINKLTNWVIRGGIGGIGTIVIGGAAWLYNYSTNNKLENQVTNLTTNMDSMNGIIKELTQNYTSLQDNYTSLQDNYTSLQDNYTSSQNNYTSLQDNYTSLQNNYTSLQNNVTSVCHACISECKNNLSAVVSDTNWMQQYIPSDPYIIIGGAIGAIGLTSLIYTGYNWFNRNRQALHGREIHGEIAANKRIYPSSSYFGSRCVFLKNNCPKAESAYSYRRLVK